MVVTRNAKILFAILLAIIAAVLFVPQTGEARTQAQAQSDANYYSTLDCPHHSQGKCLRRTATITSGIGGGRWTASIQGWECVWAEPCGLNGDYRKARWYYTRTFWIENNGSRSHVSGFSNDG